MNSLLKNCHLTREDCNWTNSNEEINYSLSSQALCNRSGLLQDKQGGLQCRLKFWHSDLMLCWSFSFSCWDFFVIIQCTVISCKWSPYRMAMYGMSSRVKQSIKTGRAKQLRSWNSMPVLRPPSVSQHFNLGTYKVRPCMVYWTVQTQSSTWCPRTKLIEAYFLLLSSTNMIATSWTIFFKQLRFVSLPFEEYSHTVSCPIQVTTQLLMTTNGGKRLRALTKHQDLNIKATAAEVLNVWKGTIAAQNSAEAKAAQKAKEQLGESHASHHFTLTIVIVIYCLSSFGSHLRSIRFEWWCRKVF